MLEEAEREYRAAILLKGDNLPARLQLGKLLEERGELTRAGAEYAAATEVLNRFPPGSRGYLRAADPWYVYGRFLAEHGKPAEALASYRRAVEIQPGSSMFQTGLGKLLFETGETREGKEHLLEALRLDPGSATAINNLAVVLASEGSLEEAIRWLNEVLRLDPDHAEAHNNVGTALLLLEKPDEAIPHFQRALELRPDFDLARKNLEAARHRLRSP
jgi:tetratricopeptide (TPR) repeat protein